MKILKQYSTLNVFWLSTLPRTPAYWPLYRVRMRVSVRVSVNIVSLGVVRIMDTVRVSYGWQLITFRI